MKERCHHSMATKKETEPAVVEAAEEETVVETRKAAHPKAAKATVESCRFSVYLGPSIRGVIQRGTILNGTKEEALASISYAVEKFPLIASLVVPDETIAEDRVKVKSPGNLLYVNYRKLASGQKSK